ncbi:MAG TPA: serine/threonine-protein kinase [Candidatus Acidoferrales bacterium]|nr:serine/threonine-protein kinase [Candidatus Acidoferrales bacterium]
MSCPACGSEVSGTARFCPSCGRAVDFGSTPTLGPEAAPRGAGAGGSSHGAGPRKRDSSPSSRISSSNSSFDGARFTPGTVLEERYRIVAMAGRGGMGEVYRAEDLKLSQTVALKFLPAAIAQDGAALARLHREVRVARQVSHPNVCRVFDIGDADGLPFLTMEYVDGEDLASLLRRIGRLPPDKAVEVARQICAGLAAAHEHGVIHRDLKPANVMIDGRGKVRITDFGLAGVAGSFEAEGAGAGTPAYMAPELLAGKDASVQSDIYALGLVLYEVFTGKRAFEAATIAELRRLHEHSSPTNPSHLVKDIDPIAERVILRCLEKDPAKRPASALQVAAALPGGDPLAAALAAGETPSPEMVAASGESEGLRPVVAWALLAGVILSVAAAILLSAQAKLYRRVPLEKPPEALAERARDILQSAGYSEAPADTAMGFYEGNEFLRYIQEHDKSMTRWDHLETGAFVFWYRGSPRPLGSFSSSPDEPMLETIWTDDPPLDVSGMTLVKLNPLGRLTQLIAVPPQIEKPAGAAAPPDWAPLFSAAGLDPAKWPPAQPTWTPPVYSDTRAAWTGTLAERPDVPMRIEAAAYRGKPVYFELIGPWTRPERMQPYQPNAGEKVGLAFIIVMSLSLMVAGVMLARRNLRMGRGDRRGAFRLAVFILAAWGLAWFLGVHHVPTGYEFVLFLMSLSVGLLLSCLSWILYIAMEPYVRRRWPATLVSWSRLLAGGFRDPLVGRDMLAGCLLGAFSITLVRLGWFVPSWLGHPPERPYSGPNWQFLGARTLIAALSNNLIGALFVSLAFLFILFLLRALLRKEWAAAAAFVFLFTLFQTAGNQTLYDPVVWGTGLISTSLSVFLLMRFGLLAFVASGFFNLLLSNFPLTTQGSAWYAGISLAGILLMAAMAFYAFYTSLGGRPVFGGAALEE